MKVEAELIDGYKATLYNKCSCLGNYFAEDDWNLVVYGESEEELKRNISDTIMNSDINVDDVSILKIRLLKYDGMYYDYEIIESLGKTIYYDLINSDFHKQRVEEKRQKRLEQEKIQAQANQLKREKEKEENDKKLYEELKKKYENK